MVGQLGDLQGLNIRPYPYLLSKVSGQKVFKYKPGVSSEHLQERTTDLLVEGYNTDLHELILYFVCVAQYR